MELVQLRDARLTDIDRIVGLMERTDSDWSSERLSDAADVLRQMVYLPNATLVVALDGRMLVGFAVLALRPSVAAGGLVGTVDLLASSPAMNSMASLEGLLRELIRSARNKGCVVGARRGPRAARLGGSAYAGDGCGGTASWLAGARPLGS